jgi:hypothetical protein
MTCLIEEKTKLPTKFTMYKLNSVGTKIATIYMLEFELHSNTILIYFKSEISSHYTIWQKKNQYIIIIDIILLLFI